MNEQKPPCGRAGRYICFVNSPNYHMRPYTPVTNTIGGMRSTSLQPLIFGSPLQHNPSTSFFFLRRVGADVVIPSEADYLIQTSENHCLGLYVDISSYVTSVKWLGFESFCF